jgi:hypothetical protein
MSTVRVIPGQTERGEGGLRQLSQRRWWGKQRENWQIPGHYFNVY